MSLLQDGSFEYVKLHIKSNQGNQYLTSAEARERAASDPDFMTRSLYEDIEAGKFPSWDVYGQIISPEVAETYPINIFDPTKTLPSTDFPYRPFGRIVLNENVNDQFAEVEQAAFSPTSIVPGWALSPDPGTSVLFASNDLDSHVYKHNSTPSPRSGLPGHTALPPRHQLLSAPSQPSQARLQSFVP